jgi:hypothetical protein
MHSPSTPFRYAMVPRQEGGTSRAQSPVVQLDVNELEFPPIKVLEEGSCSHLQGSSVGGAARGWGIACAMRRFGKAISSLLGCMKLLCEMTKWRIQQAAEIQEMLFRNPQPTSMNEAIQHLRSDFPREEEGIKDLELASNELERAMRQVNRLDQKRWKQPVVVGDSLEDFGSSEQFGPKARVLTTHQAIFERSRFGPNASFVWISKTSMVNSEGKIGYPARCDEIRQFGDRVRKIFIYHPPSELQKSFASVVMD